MTDESSNERKSALDSSDFHSAGFEWEWPLVWILVGLVLLWLWRTHWKNEVERRQSKELCRQSLKDLFPETPPRDSI
jgi:hypothetical protein